MKKVEYSQIVRYKLRRLKIQLTQNFGVKVAKQTINKILCINYLEFEHYYRMTEHTGMRGIRLM